MQDQGLTATAYAGHGSAALNLRSLNQALHSFLKPSFDYEGKLAASYPPQSEQKHLCALQCKFIANHKH